MKVWTLSNYQGYIKGVYLDKNVALEDKKPNDSIEEWEPTITDRAAEIIKNIAQEIEDDYR